MKRELPVLFSTEMVAANNAGRKTNTRRTSGLDEINEHPDDWRLSAISQTVNTSALFTKIGEDVLVRCPYGKPGDFLYVRENWRLRGWDFDDGTATVEYADGTKLTGYPFDDGEKSEKWILNQVESIEKKGIISLKGKSDDAQFIFTDNPQPWKPSIHLPKNLSRTWLEVTDVRVERLQDISEADAISEGIEPVADGWRNYLEERTTNFCFKTPVDSFMSLWKSIGGEGNPWVWVISYQVVTKTGR